jgi:hypothetical protein
VDHDEELLGDVNMMDDNVNDVDRERGESGGIERTQYRSNHYPAVTG